MKQFSLKRMALSAVALLTVGVASAETETYEFTSYMTANDVASGTTVTKGDQLTVGTYTQMWYLKCGTTETFSNRFGIGTRTDSPTTDASSQYIWMNAGDYKGLRFQYGSRALAVLSLHNKDKVTFTLGSGSFTFIGTPALAGVGENASVSSGTTYTVSTDADAVYVLVQSGANNSYIQSIEIQTFEEGASETVTVGEQAYSNTYNFKNSEDIALDNTDASSSKARDMFGGKFSITSKGTDNDIQITSEYGFKVLYANKPITVKNLKKGENIQFNFTNGESSTGFSISGTSILEGLEDDAALTPGTTYTVSSNGNLILNNSTKNPTIQSIVISKEKVNIGGATLVSENALDFSEVTEVKAYVATAAEKGTVTFTQVNKVPANTPLYLTADDAVSIEVPVLEGEADAIATNLLKGSASATTSLQSTDAIKYYVFGVKNGVSGFYPVSDSQNLTSAAGKAYLQLTAEQAATAPMLWLNFEDAQTTGVNEVRSKMEEVRGIYYNLAGQRVDNPTKGIYIVNGKKVVIK